MTARFRSPAGLALAAALIAGGALSRPLHAQDTSAARSAPAPTPVTNEVALTAAQRRAYVGTYGFTRQDGSQMSLRVYDDNGSLTGEPTGQTPKRLVYLGKDVFHPEGMPEFTLTFTLVDGHATKIAICRGDGSVLEATLVPPSSTGRP
jgi:hypothetical protein